MREKAEIKAAEVVGWLGPGALTIAAVPEYVTPDNVARLVREDDHVLLYAQSSSLIGHP